MGRVKGKSKEEIIKLFQWLNFKDELGHSLTLCKDFHDLLELIEQYKNG